MGFWKPWAEKQVEDTSPVGSFSLIKEKVAMGRLGFVLLPTSDWHSREVLF